MKFRYILYAVFITVISTALSWGGMLKSSVNSSGYGGGSSYSSGYSGGGSWGGGSGGHK